MPTGYDEPEFLSYAIMVLTAYNTKGALQLTLSISEHSGCAIALHVMSGEWISGLRKCPTLPIPVLAVSSLRAYFRNT
jgi:hypothetical protein